MNNQEVDEFYEVQKIVSKRLNLCNNIEEEYLIRWKGYTAKDDSWLKEDDCVACYDLIVIYEAVEFSKIQQFHPEVMGIKIYHRRIKLRIKWRENEDTKDQYFYSYAVRLIAPKILIDFYEKLISKNENSLQKFPIPNDYGNHDDSVADKILAVINCSPNGKISYVIAWKNKNEVSVIDESSVKSRFPCLLVKFYESNLFEKKSHNVS